MREIKFRGKNLDTNEWCYGCLEFMDEYFGIIHAYNKRATTAVRFVSSQTVGQFTGLRDKNGKEIYEGDIVCQHEEPYNLDYIGVVFYDSDTASFRIENRNKWGGKYAFIKSKIVNDGNARVPVEYSYEVIGNIYDNPELLK